MPAGSRSYLDNSSSSSRHRLLTQVSLPQVSARQGMQQPPLRQHQQHQQQLQLAPQQQQPMPQQQQQQLHLQQHPRAHAKQLAAEAAAQAAKAAAAAGTPVQVRGGLAVVLPQDLMRAVMAARPDDGAGGKGQPGGGSSKESLLQAAANDELDGSLRRAGWEAKKCREHMLICDGEEIRRVDGFGEVGEDDLVQEVDGFVNHFTCGMLDADERVELNGLGVKGEPVVAANTPTARAAAAAAGGATAVAAAASGSAADGEPQLVSWRNGVTESRDAMLQDGGMLLCTTAFYKVQQGSSSEEYEAHFRQKVLRAYAHFAGEEAPAAGAG